MTQAFNLAQLANNLNTSGQLDATDGLSGLVANANLASSGTASSSTYLRGDRTWASLPTFGKILQVVQATKTDTQYIANNSGSVAITGLSVSITPSSTSSRILAMWTIGIGVDNNEPGIILYRNGSATSFIGNAAGSRTRVSGGTLYAGLGYMQTVCGSYVDSPSSTSAQTYAMYAVTTAAGNIYINQSPGDSDSTAYVRGASSLIVCEIGA